MKRNNAIAVWAHPIHNKNKFNDLDMANDIINHMEKLNIDKADIVGVSQGGMIAQYIAINAPEKVNKLVLAVTTSRTNDILNKVVSDWIEKAKNKDYKGIMIDNAEKSYTGSYLEKNRKVYKLRRKIGVVFQDFKLLPKLTVYEKICF